jgi:hypothetical protein
MLSEEGLMPHSTATLAQALSGIGFPASRDQVIDHARRHGASGDTLAVLEELSADRYLSMAELFAGLREQEHRRTQGDRPEPLPPPMPAPDKPPD